MVGQTIAHYRILEKLGEGGMGVVYKAEDTRLDRTVALKFLALHLLESNEHKQRFLREAKAAASLDHPNICMVHEVGEANGQVFLAMGFIDGSEVRAKIKERPLKLGDALDIAIQAAEGLRAAHQKGVVHRDIKSSNLMLTSTGQVKIMDFGLAQLSGGTRITRTETVLGTPAYMSPEQAQRLETDRRTDIWSLGVVLYEMITGRLPFEGEREAAVVHSIIHEPHEPITAIRAGLPLELERIVGKALAKKPEERYQHVDDLLVDLRALRSGAALSTAGRQVRWFRLASAAAVSLLATGYLTWRTLRPSVPDAPIRAIALTTFSGQELNPSFSPDGNYVVFTWNGPKQDNFDIYLQQIGTDSPLRLTTDAHRDYSPVWSPDGKWIAFLRSESSALYVPGEKNELLVRAPLGGPERRLAEIHVRATFVSPPSYIAWCPGGDCLIVTDSRSEDKPDALFVVSLETGAKRALTNPQPPGSGDISPAISPDGRRLAFRRNASLVHGEIYWLSLQPDLTVNGEPQRLTDATMDADYPAWTPDGDQILFSAKGSLWRVDVPGASQLARLPFLGEDGIMPVITRGQPGMAPRLAYVRSFRDFNILRIDVPAPGNPASAPPALAISSTRIDGAPSFSPDGRRVAFGSERSGESEIWLADADGSNAVQLTHTNAQATWAPRWSPAGRDIVFHSNADGQFKVYGIPAAGGKPRRLTSGQQRESFPNFSRDGRWIYYASVQTSGGNAEIWKVPAAGGEAVRINRARGYIPFESTDGAHLFYLDTIGGPSNLWRLPLVPSGEPKKILESAILWNFWVMDLGIYYIHRAGEEIQLRFLNFATDKSTIVARNIGTSELGLTATPDGRTILYTRIEPPAGDIMLAENFR